jgi:hypothetical protein
MGGKLLIDGWETPKQLVEREEIFGELGGNCGEQLVD